MENSKHYAADTEEKISPNKSNQFDIFDSFFKQSDEYWRKVSETMSDSEYEAWILSYVNRMGDKHAANFDKFDSVFKDLNLYWRRISETMSDSDYESWIFEYVQRDDDITGSDDNDATKKIVVEELYCLCQQPESGEMIACDNSQCRTEWFHFKCVDIREPPPGDWFCQDCRMGEDYKCTDYKQYRCYECEKTFSRKAHMKEHKRTHRKHHNDFYGPIPCPECRLTFTTVMKLRKHLENNVHTNRRPFQCKFCLKSFKQKVHMKSHQAVLHNKSEPHKCEVCHKTFKIKSYLTKHRAIHRYK